MEDEKKFERLTAFVRNKRALKRKALEESKVRGSNVTASQLIREALKKTFNV